MPDQISAIPDPEPTTEAPPGYARRIVRPSAFRRPQKLEYNQDGVKRRHDAPAVEIDEADLDEAD